MKSNIWWIFLLCCGVAASAYGQTPPLQDGVADRRDWLQYLDRLAGPVLENLAADQLKAKMSVVVSPHSDNPAWRKQVAYLEAFGRLMSGIGPWLNGEGGSADEVKLRDHYRRLALLALDKATDSTSADYMRWTGGQPLVDASFLALGLIRCPWLWEHSSDKVKQQVAAAFRLTRSTIPPYNNWLLFSAMIETFFCRYGFDYNPVVIEYAVREFSAHWYVGDGLFSDGTQYHWDYYNSYVIQPYLSTVVQVMQEKKKLYGWYLPSLDKITKRYAELQERMINADGSYPVTGRSIVYRGGAFHHLAYMALVRQLPASLPPAQVRSALSAVIRKTSEAPSGFNKGGWLTLGLYGEQPDLADSYITTGSLYLCADILLPLGLSPEDPFWSGPGEGWTSLKVWSGQDLPADHALELH